MTNFNGRMVLPICSVALFALAARTVAPLRRPRGGPGLGW